MFKSTYFEEHMRTTNCFSDLKHGTRAFRSSRPEVLCKKAVLKNFAEFTGKHLCQGLFFNKVEGLSPATLLKKRLAQVFSFEFCEISEKPFFIEHL